MSGADEQVLSTDSRDQLARSPNLGRTAMLAEIFMLQVEAEARTAKDKATRSRFVPITLPTPVVKAS